jgi:type IV pilus assembly protein PilA
MRSHGFTLIELLIVVAIIGIMASMAILTYQDQVIRAQISEATGLADSLKTAIRDYYQTHQRFPANNEEAGLPQPAHLIGNFVTAMEVQDDTIHIHLGHHINLHAANKILSLRPKIVSANPSSPISWLCGYAQAVPGMAAVGENRTDVSALYLSPSCRQRSG